MRVREGLLTGEQIGSILDSLAVDPVQAAALFGTTADALGKYIRGESLQSTATDRLLRLAWRFGMPALEFLGAHGRGALPERRRDQRRELG